MKIMYKFLICLGLVLFLTPIISGQDLSRYRKFSLGTSLADLSKQVGPYSHETTLAHQRPAVIQEMTFWPLSPSRSAVGLEPVSQILFSFCNGELYRIMVTYERDAIEGLTEEDMVQAISTQYGTATRFYPEINFPTNNVYASPEMIIARWGDSENAVNLLRSGDLTSYRLAVFSKRLDAQADAAIAESVRLDKQEAPQKEVDRQKKEADDLEATRQKNQKTFRP